MKDAFAYAHKAMGRSRPENLTEMVKSPFGQGQMAKGAAALARRVAHLRSLRADGGVRADERHHAAGQQVI